MNNQFKLPDNPNIAEKIINSEHEKERIKIEHGLLGRVWGTSSSIPNNIAALSILILLCFGVLYTVIIIYYNNDHVLSIKDCWSIITPIITLAFGYLFGEKSKKENI